MIGFLHTASVHTAAFEALAAGAAPGVPTAHAVDEALLEHARAHGEDEALRARTRQRLAELAARGAAVIVCTCSTVGGVAERLAPAAGVPVLRVDRPMARAAVRAGQRIAVVAALPATVEPTSALLAECAAEAGVAPEITPFPCPDAWPLFEAGDVDGYLRAVAAHARSLAGRTEVIVLAQASMAPAAELLSGLPVPVFSSPRLGVAAAAALART